MDSKIHWLTPFLVLIVAAHVSAGRDLVKINLDAVLNEQERLTVQADVRMEGRAGGSLRAALQVKRPAERMVFLEQKLAPLFGGIRLIDFDLMPSDPGDDASSLRISLRFFSDDAVAGGHLGYAVLRMPSLAGLVQEALSQVERDAEGQSVAGALREVSRLDLTRSGWRVHELPERESAPQEGIRQTIVQREPGMLEAETVLEPPFDAEGLGRIRESGERCWVILQRTGLFDEADWEVLDERVVYTLIERGHWREERWRDVRVHTPEGCREMSELRVSYDPATTEVHLETAAVWTDGTVHAIDPEVAMQRIENLDDGTEMVRVHFQGVEEGSVIRTHIVLTHRGLPFFSAAEPFSGMEPIRSKRVQVRLPASQALSHEVSSGGGVIRTSWEEGKLKIYEWNARNHPVIRREAHRPPQWLGSPVLFLSQGDPQAVADRVGREVLQAASASRPVRRLARELIAEQRTRDQQIIALRDWVDREIRLTQSERSGVPPGGIRIAGQILEERSGTRAERMVLLHALLDAVRLRPRLVLATDLPRGTAPDAPPLQAFQFSSLSRLLVAVENEAGETVYLDETGRHAQLGYTAHAGRPSIDLQTGELVYPLTAFPDQTDTVYRIELRENGDARVEYGMRFLGRDYESFHRRFESITPEELRGEHRRRVREIGGAATADGEMRVCFDTGTVEVFAQVPGYAVRKGDVLELLLPKPPEFFSPALGTRRDHAVYVEHPAVRAVIIELVLPPGWQPVVMPPSFQVPLPSRAGQVFAQTVHSAGRMQTAYELHLRPGIIPLEQYGALLQVQGKLIRPSARTLLLRRP